MSNPVGILYNSLRSPHTLTYLLQTVDDNLALLVHISLQWSNPIRFPTSIPVSRQIVLSLTPMLENFLKLHFKPFFNRWFSHHHLCGNLQCANAFHVASITLITTSKQLNFFGECRRGCERCYWSPCIDYFHGLPGLKNETFSQRHSVYSVVYSPGDAGFLKLY